MKCIFCQSTRHSYRECPIAWKNARKRNVHNRFQQEYFGEAPNIFIGRYGYPNVRVGILGTEQYTEHDEPVHWSKQNTPIQEIIRLRSELVNSYFQQNVKGIAQFSEVAREVSLAQRPVDVEFHLKKQPRFRMSFSPWHAPHGPNVGLQHAAVTENAKRDRHIERMTDATDLTASEAITNLAQRGVDPYYVTRAFSMGNFGLPTERKIVPTRWSITAVDDIRGKELIGQIRDYEPADCMAFFGGHYGNYYLLLFFDDIWRYELYEHDLPSGQSWTDFEPHTGRRSYAGETAGGYYAARVGILERLVRMRRQSSVLALRFISNEYTAPLGVWVVREAVRKALAGRPIRFADRRLLLEYARELLKRKFSDSGEALSKSRLLRELFGQRRLTDY